MSVFTMNTRYCEYIILYQQQISIFQYSVTMIELCDSDDEDDGGIAPTHTASDLCQGKCNIVLIPPLIS